MAQDQLDSDAEPDAMEAAVTIWRSQLLERTASLTQLPSPDPGVLNAPLSDEAKTMLHRDAATCRRMMDALRIGYPSNLLPRQFTAGLISATGRFVYPDGPRHRPNPKAGQPRHSAAAAAADVAPARQPQAVAMIAAFEEL